MEIKTFFAQDRMGNLSPNAQCAVYLSDTNTLAVIYDSLGNVIANPLLADGNGQITFSAADGTYDVFVASMGVGGPRIKMQLVDLGAAVDVVNAGVTTVNEAVVSVAADAEAAEQFRDGAQANAQVASDNALQTITDAEIVSTTKTDVLNIKVQVQTIADGVTISAAAVKTFTITAGDPDGTIAGLAGTTDGQAFYVAQGTASLISLKLYKHVGTAAVEYAEVAGSAAYSQIIDIIKRYDGVIPYIFMMDQYGRVGPGFKAYYSDNSFGTVFNRVSDTGLETLPFSIKWISGDQIITTDIYGRTKQLGSAAASATTTSFNDSTTTLEADATHQWLLGGSDGWEKSLIGSHVLTRQSNLIVRRNSIAAVPLTGSLITDIPDSGLYTICMAIQIPSIQNTTDRIGIYTFTANTANAGIRTYFYKDTNGKVLISSGRAINDPYAYFMMPDDYKAGDWIFFAHVVKIDNIDNINYQSLYVGGIPYKKLRLFDVTTKVLSANMMGLGNPIFAGAAWATQNTNIAEAAYFPSARSSDQLKATYENFKAALSSSRSINLR